MRAFLFILLAACLALLQGGQAAELLRWVGGEDDPSVLDRWSDDMGMLHAPTPINRAHPLKRRRASHRPNPGGARARRDGER